MAENRKKTPEKKETDGNFNYIVRIANTDIDGEKKPAIALTTVKGIGLRSAEIIVRQTGVSRYRRFGEVPQEKVEEIENIVLNFHEHAPVWFLNRQRDWETNENIHLVGTDRQSIIEDDINRLKKIRSYRGIRHETHHKVRGQRTRSNGRKGLTLGVSKRK